MFKNIIKYMMINIFILLIVLQGAQINHTTVYAKNKNDVIALKHIIKVQRKRGADVSKNINSIEYTWEKGRLIYMLVNSED